MKTRLLVALALLLVKEVRAQVFNGLAGASYAVAQLKDNPAFAIHGQHAQINFGSVGFAVGGNSVQFKPSIWGFLNDGQADIQKDYTKNTVPGSKSFYGFFELNGPYVSALVKRQYFFAFGTSLRYMVNSDNLNDNVFKLLGANARPDTNAIDSYSIKNYAITAQMVNEWRLSYATYLVHTEQKKLVAGITLKLLNGIGAAGMGITNGSFYTRKDDNIVHGATGNVRVAFTPNAHNWAIAPYPLNSYNQRTNNIGIGADIGIIYYFNPNETMQLRPGYLMRFAMSVTDIGSINYSKSSTSGTYTLNNADLDYKNIQNNSDVSFGNRIFYDFLSDTLIKTTGGIKKFKVGLPTALHLNADLKLLEQMFVNVDALVNLRSPDAHKFANHYITTLTISPRFTYRRFAAAMPFTFNRLGQGFTGLVVCAGPVYMGCNSLFQTVGTSSTAMLNFYMGGVMRLEHKNERFRALMTF
ncbi:MAG: hypothetical protein EBX41_05870 [Chitinophagia bacterium]|nr:hypothetical protein [Chitinophagia bacterium]